MMDATGKAQVVATDNIGNFILANPTSGRQSLMTSWENWLYDDSVLVGMREDITNLKADCEKTVFSLYNIQTAIRDDSAQIQDLQGNDQTTAQKKLQELQDHIQVASKR